jgi:hypothetical protein
MTSNGSRAYLRRMRTEAMDSQAVIRGASRGFGVLVIGGLVQPMVSMSFEPLGYVWLLVVAVTAFLTAAVAATPDATPTSRWRQGPVAAVASYAMVVPLVMVGAGELPWVQAVLTTLTAVIVGAAVALARTHYAADRAQPLGT